MTSSALEADHVQFGDLIRPNDGALRPAIVIAGLLFQMQGDAQPHPSRADVHLPVTETDPHLHRREEKCHHVDEDRNRPRPVT